MQELENEERFNVGGRCDEEEKVSVGKTIYEGRRVRVGEVDEGRSRGRVFEVEREEVGCGKRPASVDVGEDGIPGAGSVAGLWQKHRDNAPIVIKDVKSFNDAAHCKTSRRVTALLNRDLSRRDG